VTEYIWSRPIGRARLAVICEGNGGWPLERALAGVPEAVWRPLVPTNRNGRIPISFNLAHLALDGASILLDTGWGEHRPDTADPPLTAIADWELTPGVEPALAQLGVRPEAVTHILITHMHWDHIIGAYRHVGGRPMPAYPNARVHVLDAEWQDAPAHHQPAGPINTAKAILEAAGLVERHAGEHEVLPGVRLIPSPGESPGHALVRIETGADSLYYVGDLVHLPAELAHPEWHPPFRDPAALLASRRHWFPRFADEQALILVAHMPFPALGRVLRDGDHFRWQPL